MHDRTSLPSAVSLSSLSPVRALVANATVAAMLIASPSSLADDPAPPPPPVSLTDYDFNGDGASDRIRIGARWDDLGNAITQVGVCDGAAMEPRFVLESGVPNGMYGFALAGVGDLDHDGASDLLIGAPQAEIGGAASGAVEVRSGADGSLIMTLIGEPDSAFGYAVGSAGDFNGDGALDFAVTSVQTDEADNLYWRVHLYSGSTFTRICTLVTDVPDDGFGVAITALGDLDGDGFDDIAISAADALGLSGERGAAFVVLGRDPADDTIVVSEADAYLTCRNGNEEISYFGYFLLPTTDDDTGEVDGLVALSLRSEDTSEPLHISTQFDLTGAAINFQNFDTVFPVGDVDSTQTVDTGDVSHVIADVGTTSDPTSPTPTDIDQDGAVDSGDVSVVVTQVGFLTARSRRSRRSDWLQSRRREGITLFAVTGIHREELPAR